MKTLSIQTKCGNVYDTIYKSNSVDDKEIFKDLELSTEIHGAKNIIKAAIYYDNRRPLVLVEAGKRI